MTTTTDILAQEIAGAEIRAALLGKKCWHGYVSAGNTFQIALGRKVARSREETEARLRVRARRAAHDVRGSKRENEFTRFAGESNLLVWCSWRLDRRNGPLTSWDGEAEQCEAGICRLVGRTVKSVDIGAGWDLRLAFSGELLLTVFPDHVGEAASFDGNWEVWRKDQAYLIGTDLACEVIDRENRPLRLRDRQGRWAPVSGSR